MVNVGLLLAADGDGVAGLGKLVESTAGRSEAAYLAIMVLLFAGVVVIGTGYLIIKWLPNLVNSFREEMKTERESHQADMIQARNFYQSQCELLRSEHKEDLKAFAEAIRINRDAR